MDFDWRSSSRTESMASMAAARRQVGKREETMFGNERRARSPASAASRFCSEMKTSLIAQEKRPGCGHASVPARACRSPASAYFLIPTNNILSLPRRHPTSGHACLRASKLCGLGDWGLGLASGCVIDVEWSRSTKSPIHECARRARRPRPWREWM